MSRSCVTVRSCPHRLAGNADGDDVAGSGEAVRPRAGLVVVAGEQDAGAVAEVGAEQCRSNTEELLILVIPDLRDALDADAFMSCSSIGCCFEDCFAMTWVAPAEWPGYTEFRERLRRRRAGGTRRHAAAESRSLRCVAASSLVMTGCSCMSSSCG